MTIRYRVHCWVLPNGTFLDREWGGFQSEHELWKTSPKTSRYVVIEDEHGEIYLSDFAKAVADDNAMMHLDKTLRCQTVEAARMAAQMKK